ncbi:hypothetical protein BD626DRAFT_520340, partial [Schizophyllum amplum]
MAPDAILTNRSRCPKSYVRKYIKQRCSCTFSTLRSGYQSLQICTYVSSIRLLAHGGSPMRAERESGLWKEYMACR